MNWCACVDCVYRRSSCATPTTTCYSRAASRATATSASPLALSASTADTGNVFVSACVAEVRAISSPVLTKLVYSYSLSRHFVSLGNHVQVHYEFLCRRRLYDISQVYTASRGGRSPNSIQFCCYYIYIWDSSLPKIVKVETHFLKKTGLCVNKISFLPRDAMYKRGLCRHAVSVCLSVCSSRS